MKKIWNFLLKYRLFIVLIILIVFVAVLGILMKHYLDPIDETVIWGDRLDGISEVPISDLKLKEVEKFILEDENVTKANVRIVGKTIKVIILTSTEKDTVKKMQELGDEIISKFEEKEVKFYEFSFSIENKDANYVLVGEKKDTNENISWSTDLIEKSEVEVDEEE